MKPNEWRATAVMLAALKDVERERWPVVLEAVGDAIKRADDRIVKAPISVRQQRVASSGR